MNMIEITEWFNPILQGWLNYYGKYTRSSLYAVWRHFNLTLVSWSKRKYKSLRNSKDRSFKFISRIAKENSDLFIHWRIGMEGGFF
jgi:RNA-directed DNA polymerase